RRQHGPDARVADYVLRLVEVPSVVRRREKMRVPDVPRAARGTTDLREDVPTVLLTGPPIDGSNQSVKRELSTDGDENHRTCPAYSGPRGRARCGHCVSQSPAHGLTSDPDIDTRSTFAKLSSQMVLAPSMRPNSRPKTPGADPVEITIDGRTRNTIASI